MGKALPYRWVTKGQIYLLWFSETSKGEREGNVCYLLQLTLNVVSDFNFLSLLTVPSRFSDPPRDAVGSWSYLSIKAKVSSQRPSLSSGVSRCLYPGPSDGDALIQPQAVLSVQQTPWTAKYDYSLLAPLCLNLGSWILRLCLTPGGISLHKTSAPLME